jgi:tRNA pseudouridine38-40 synthase
VRYFLELAFDGTAYHGWQRQPNAHSVQQELEEALSVLLGQPIEVVAAGRTDAGVHAAHMVVHFDYSQAFDVQALIHRLNRFLPEALVISKLVEVHPEAHARFDAISRTYRYRISTRKDPFSERFTWQLHQPLDLESMNLAAQYLIGTHDFECFSKSHTDVKTFICTVAYARFTQQAHEIHFEIRADRFLRNMVRAIVGTLVEVGWHKRALSSIPELIASKSRSEAGVSVPAKGLSLIAIEYPELRLHAN